MRGKEPVVAVDGGSGDLVSTASLGLGPAGDLAELFRSGVSHDTLRSWGKAAERSTDRHRLVGHFEPAPLVRNPSKLIGIGINYRAHGDDLDAPAPTAPAFFLKGNHTITGPVGPIVLPSAAKDVTSEGELALVVGKTANKVPVDSALEYIAGACVALDQTAEDILRENTRFLTRAKNFSTFLCLSDELVPIEEVVSPSGKLDHLVVGTYLNGELVAENRVANMFFSPEYIVSFCSHVMPLHPGDVITTGTPGAAHINAGDVVEARVSAVGSIFSSVIPEPT
jgi:2-keto-4-pentenoate hydratase/2-oxohepta-3-ene-1,7-dioic acid hydratase in catechol pathway